MRTHPVLPKSPPATLLRRKRWPVRRCARSSAWPSSGSCVSPSSASCWASGRRCRSCFPTRPRPMRGCTSRTRRRCSAANRRWSACCRATSPICSWCGNTWTHSAAESRCAARRTQRYVHRRCCNTRQERTRRAVLLVRWRNNIAHDRRQSLADKVRSSGEDAAIHGNPMSAPLPPVKRIRWNQAFRIVPSRFPTIGVYDRIADPADLDAVFALEAMTNPRLREEAGALQQVAKERRLGGPGSTPVMAAFTHLNPEGSRFSDGTWGVFYAAHSVATAVEETAYHRERFLAATGEPACEIQMRCYRTHLDSRLHDIRGGWPASS